MAGRLHPRSWYTDTALPQPDHPELAGEIRCDVCVVGGGYTGLSTALHLAERGYDVVVLEAEKIDVAPWITHRVTPEELPGAFPGWVTPESQVVKAMLEL